jgi:hypothetical protein
MDNDCWKGRKVYSAYTGEEIPKGPYYIGDIDPSDPSKQFHGGIVGTVACPNNIVMHNDIMISKNN